MKEINLGKKSTSGPIPIQTKEEKNKVFYPNVYLSDIKGLDLPDDGEFEFKGKARLTRKTKDLKNDSFSCEFDLISITPLEVSEDEDLERAMDKVVSRKQKKMMDEDEKDEYD